MKMKIDGKMIEVDVNDKNCRKRWCLRPGLYMHRNAVGKSGISKWKEDKYSCLTRDNHGCPDEYCEQFQEAGCNHKQGMVASADTDPMNICRICGKRVKWTAYCPVKEIKNDT